MEDNINADDLRDSFPPGYEPRDYVENNEQVDREELMLLFGGRYKVPDYETLRGRYIAGRIAQKLSSARDEKRRRLILAARDGDEIKYIYVTACKDKKLLKFIQRRIERDIDGKNASLQIVERQIGMFD